MNIRGWDDHKRGAIGQSLEDLAKSLGRQDELKEFNAYMDLICKENNTTQRQIESLAPDWIKVLLPTLNTLYNSAYYYALNIKSRETAKFENLNS